MILLLSIIFARLVAITRYVSVINVDETTLIITRKLFNITSGMYDFSCNEIT